MRIDVRRSHLLVLQQREERGHVHKNDKRHAIECLEDDRKLSDDIGAGCEADQLDRTALTENNNGTGKCNIQETDHIECDGYSMRVGHPAVIPVGNQGSEEADQDVTKSDRKGKEGREFALGPEGQKIISNDAEELKAEQPIGGHCPQDFLSKIGAKDK